jgi:transcriptional regulator with XRE-family HTH domain
MFLNRRKNNILGKMRAKRLNQKKLAQKLNLSESYITRLINGERYNRQFEIFIAMELGVNYRNFR